MAAEKRPIARKARMRGGELDGENALEELFVGAVVGGGGGG